MELTKVLIEPIAPVIEYPSMFVKYYSGKVYYVWKQYQYDMLVPGWVLHIGRADEDGSNFTTLGTRAVRNWDSFDVSYDINNDMLYLAYPVSATHSMYVATCSFDCTSFSEVTLPLTSAYRPKIKASSSNVYIAFHMDSSTNHIYLGRCSLSLTGFSYAELPLAPDTNQKLIYDIAINASRVYYIMKFGAKVYTALSNLDGSSFVATNRNSDLSYVAGYAYGGMSVEVDSSKVYYAWSDPPSVGTAYPSYRNNVWIVRANLDGSSAVRNFLYFEDAPDAVRYFNMVLSGSFIHFLLISGYSGGSGDRIKMGRAPFVFGTASYATIFREDIGGSFQSPGLTAGATWVQSIYRGVDKFNQQAIITGVEKLSDANVYNHIQLTADTNTPIDAAPSIQIVDGEIKWIARMEHIIYHGALSLDGTAFGSSYYGLPRYVLDRPFMHITADTTYYLFLDYSNDTSNIDTLTWGTIGGGSFIYVTPTGTRIRGYTNPIVEGTTAYMFMTTFGSTTKQLYHITFDITNVSGTKVLTPLTDGSMFIGALTRMVRAAGVSYCVWFDRTNSLPKLTKYDGITATTITIPITGYDDYYQFELEIDPANGKLYYFFLLYDVAGNVQPWYGQSTTGLTGFSFTKIHATSNYDGECRIIKHGDTLYYAYSQNDYDASNTVRALLATSNLDGTGFTQTVLQEEFNTGVFIYELDLTIASDGSVHMIWAPEASQPRRGLMYAYSVVETGMRAAQTLLSAITNKIITFVKKKLAYRLAWYYPDTSNFIQAINSPMDSAGNFYFMNGGYNSSVNKDTYKVISINKNGVLRWQSPDFFGYNGVEGLTLAGNKLILYGGYNDYNTAGAVPPYSRILCFNKDTGFVDWETDGGYIPWGRESQLHSILTNSTHVYVFGNSSPVGGTTDTIVLRAFDLVDGTLTWQRSLNELPPRTMAFSPDKSVIYVGSNATPYMTAAYNASTGATLWNIPLSSYEIFVGSDGSLYTYNWVDTLTKLDPAGNVLWTRDYKYDVGGYGIYNITGLTSSTLLVGMYSADPDADMIVALDLSDGSILWYYIIPLYNYYGIYATILPDGRSVWLFNRDDANSTSVTILNINGVPVVEAEAVLEGVDARSIYFTQVDSEGSIYFWANGGGISVDARGVYKLTK